MTDAREADGEIRVVACGRTDRGRVREENQDSLLVLDGEGEGTCARAGGDDGAATVGPFEFALGPAGAVLFVADGMGGRAGGARASGLAISTVRAAMTRSGSAATSPEAQDFVGALRRSLKEANAAVHDAGSKGDEYQGMGTTATLAGLLNGVVYIAQVGDSRAYLVRNGKTARLTRDQSLVQDLIDAGIMSEDDEHNVNDNTLLQALGVGPTVRPDITYHELRRGDVLLLCSDGLSGLLRDEEIGRAVDGAKDCAGVCDQLVTMANERGGPDNITVLAARIDGDGVEELADTDQMGRQPWKPDHS